MMPEFKTKEDVDTWYAIAVDGIGRGGALLIKNGNSNATDYTVAIVALSNVKKGLYRELGIDEEPDLISWRDAVEKHQ